MPTSGGACAFSNEAITQGHAGQRATQFNFARKNEHKSLKAKFGGLYSIVIEFSQFLDSLVSIERVKIMVWSMGQTFYSGPLDSFDKIMPFIFKIFNKNIDIETFVTPEKKICWVITILDI